MNRAGKGIAVLLILGCLLLGGCGDGQELADTDIILGVGLDAADDLVQLTVELFSAGEEQPSLLTVSGTDPEAAVSALAQRLEGELFWGAGAVIIYGPSCSWQQACSYGGFLYRQMQMSGRTLVLRSKEAEAAAILAGSFGQSKATSLGLAEGLRLAGRSGADELYLYEQLQAPDWGPAAEVSCREGQVILEVKNDGSR